MGSLKGVTVQGEQRRSSRAMSSARVSYSYGHGAGGDGVCRNVGRGGLCLRIGRYLRPGRRLLMTIRGAELMGRVMWCRADGESHHFLIGIKVFPDEEEAALALAADTVKRPEHARRERSEDEPPAVEARMPVFECSVY